MAITKLSRVKERKSGNPNAGLYNCIDYIFESRQNRRALYRRKRGFHYTGSI